MIFADLPSPAEAGFAKAGNRIKPGAGITLEKLLKQIAEPANLVARQFGPNMALDGGGAG